MDNDLVLLDAPLLAHLDQRAKEESVNGFQGCLAGCLHGKNSFQRSSNYSDASVPTALTG